MNNEFRIVCDTGVVVSALLLPESVPRQALDVVIGSCRLLLSVTTIEELDDVLRRPKFDKYLSEQHRFEFLAAFINQAEMIPITHRVSDCRDPKDNKFLELALSGRASHIVSGDDDLLSLHPFHRIAIVNPAAFLDEMKSQM